MRNRWESAQSDMIFSMSQNVGVTCATKSIIHRTTVKVNSCFSCNWSLKAATVYFAYFSCREVYPRITYDCRPVRCTNIALLASAEDFKNVSSADIDSRIAPYLGICTVATAKCGETGREDVITHCFPHCTVVSLHLCLGFCRDSILFDVDNDRTIYITTCITSSKDFTAKQFRSGVILIPCKSFCFRC